MKRLLSNNYYTLADLVTYGGHASLLELFVSNSYFGLDSTLCIALVSKLALVASSRYVLQSDFDMEDDDDADGFEEDRDTLYAGISDFFASNSDRWVKIQTAMESALTDAFDAPAYERTTENDLTDSTTGSSSTNGYTTADPTTPITLEDATDEQYIDSASAGTGESSATTTRTGTVTETGENGTKYSMDVARDIQDVYQEVGQMIYNDFARRFFIL